MTITFESLKATNEILIPIVRESITKFGIPMIEGNLIQSQGFIIKIDDIKELEEKSKQFGATLIILNTRYFEKNQELKALDSELIDMSTFDNKDVSELACAFDVFVRLGDSNTWLKYESKTAASLYVIDAYDDDEYDDDEDADDFEDEPESEESRAITMWRTEKSLEIARCDGFGHLKNTDLRRFFIEDVAKKEGWLNYSADNCELSCGGFATTAYNCYEYAVLPEKSKALQAEGKSIAEIAKILGHTKNRIEKSLAFNVSNGLIEAIERIKKRSDSKAYNFSESDFEGTREKFNCQIFSGYCIKIEIEKPVLIFSGKKLTYAKIETKLLIASDTFNPLKIEAADVINLIDGATTTTFEVIRRDDDYNHPKFAHCYIATIQNDLDIGEIC